MSDAHGHPAGTPHEKPAGEEKGKKVFVWDIDGVVLDSAKETHVLTVEALKRHKADIEKMLGRPLLNYSYKDFYADRPWAKKAHDYFIHAGVRMVQGKAASMIPKVARDAFYKKFEPLMEKLVKEFYSIRAELQKDPKKWNNLNPVYKGIPEVMKALRDAGYEFAVVSTKDKASIVSALKHHGLMHLFKEKHIFDLKAGKDRAEQMKQLLGAFGKSEYVVVDDLPDQHATSKPVFEKHGVKVQYLGAKWGYGVEWDKHRYITVVVKPEELLKALNVKKANIEYVTHHEKTVHVPFLGTYVWGKPVSRAVADQEQLKHVIVYAVVKDKKGHIILQKRAANKKDYPGLMTVSASGAAKHHETLEKAARREVKEELGVNASGFKPLWPRPVALDPKHPHRLFFPLVGTYDGKLAPDPKEVDAKGTRYYHPDEVKAIHAAKKFTPPAQNFWSMIQREKDPRKRLLETAAAWGAQHYQR